ncbi:MAG: TadE/TadG family type IV pilus assembly protein, partial [Negativicutes bacterium]|nr:TadE/TadG family type IV pilus assembly protein [Negativicutes bacterium]
MKASLPKKQKGAAAIEFALVFVIFFATFYGVVSYSLPLLMMQSFNEASAEAARRSVALDPNAFANTAAYQTQVTTTAKQAVSDQLAVWMPKALNFNISYVTATINPTTNVLTVAINYPKAGIANVIPFLTLPGIGQVPSLPDNLSAQSS